MPYHLTIYEICEVEQLLSFKKADLIKSKMFSENVKGKRRERAEKDIELSVR